MLQNFKSYLFLRTIIFVLLLIGKQGHSQKIHFDLEKNLPKELNEISGITKDGNIFWAISDAKKSTIYKLDLSGNIIQEIQISNVRLKDAEAITSDKNYLYVGDIGDNDGNRTNRSIIKILKTSIGNKSATTIKGELINFSFPDRNESKKKKNNNHDCEAMLFFKDSLYLFTKRREDQKSELFVLPVTPGNHAARSISIFKTNGLITDAALNEKETEIALIGYDEGHAMPFILVFNSFSGNDFFSGINKRYEITNEKKLNWQIEGITYNGDDGFYFCSEKSKDVSNKLYSVTRKQLIESDKKQ